MNLETRVEIKALQMASNRSHLRIVALLDSPQTPEEKRKPVKVQFACSVLPQGVLEFVRTHYLVYREPPSEEKLREAAETYCRELKTHKFHRCPTHGGRHDSDANDTICSNSLLNLLNFLKHLPLGTSFVLIQPHVKQGKRIPRYLVLDLDPTGEPASSNPAVDRSKVWDVVRFSQHPYLDGDQTLQQRMFKPEKF